MATLSCFQLYVQVTIRALCGLHVHVWFLIFHEPIHFNISLVKFCFAIVNSILCSALYRLGFTIKTLTIRWALFAAGTLFAFQQVIAKIAGKC
ncbi:unnamed protein product [Acanthoscelides obtectus]|uniref:Uncharacterized protein n=1 Tax=Acanthoscelides obtectus TaxID=200917 RepID=A0A9P0PVQ5_ACAOB|nr:unnamed protein product [Acanthoscelides obtectus]CAK1632230.1 hypothetical protein AOBTE_LOCUS7419 [Acanthoscelides obtectus]